MLETTTSGELSVSGQKIISRRCYQQNYVAQEPEYVHPFPFIPIICQPELPHLLHTHQPRTNNRCRDCASSLQRFEGFLPVDSVPAFLSAFSLGPDAFAAVPGITDQILAIGTRAYRDASADAYSIVALAPIAFSGLAIILTWWVPNTDDLISGKVAATLHHEAQDNEKIAV
jgi:hypothetical protein